MFGMGMGEILVILAIILVVLGPEKIPELARMIGKTMREVRKASNLLRDAVMVEEQPKSRRQNQPVFKDVEIEEAPPETVIHVVNLPDLKPVGNIKESLLGFQTPVISPRDVYLHKPFIETA